MFVCCYRQKHRIAWTILQTDGSFPDMHPENDARAIAPEQQPRMHTDGQQPEGHKNVIMPLRTKNSGMAHGVTIFITKFVQLTKSLQPAERMFRHLNNQSK